MISRPHGQDHSQLLEPPRRSPRRVFFRLGLGLLLSASLSALAIFVLLPWMGRRGNLNALIETAIQSLLSVSVRVEAIETDPLSEFSITRLSSISAGSGGRFQFQAERLSVLYNPLELVFGAHLREISAEGPSLFLDLDADLTGILRGGGSGAPPAPAQGPPRPAPEGSVDAAAMAGSMGGFRLDRFRLARGRLALRLAGKDILVEELDLEMGGIGGAAPMTLQAQGRVLGAGFSLRGAIAQIPPAGAGPRRWRLAALRVEVEDFDPGPILPLLVPAGLGAGGRLALSGSAGGIWPDKVDLRLAASFRDVRASGPGASALSEGDGRLEVDATVHGEADLVEFQVRLDGAAALGTGDAGPSAGVGRQGVALRLSGEFEKRLEAERTALVRIREASLDVPGLVAAAAALNISLGPAGPACSFDVKLTRVSIEKLAAHPLGMVLGPLRRSLRGDLLLEAKGKGTLRRPEIGLRFRLDRGALWDGQRQRIAADLEGEATVRGRFGGEAGPGEPSAADSLSNFWSGSESGEVDYTISRGSLSVPEALFEIPAFTAQGSLRASRDRPADPGGRPASLKLHFGTKLFAREIGCGPVVETADRQGVDAGGDVVIGLDGSGGPIHMDLRVTTPSMGPVSIQGSVAFAGGTTPEGSGSPAPGGAPLVDFRIRAEDIPNERFLATFVRDLFKERVALLENARFSGRSGIDVSARGTPPEISVEGIFTASGLGAKLEGLELEGADLVVPLRIGKPPGPPPPPVAGRIGIGRLRARGLDLEGIRIPFVLSDGAYSMPDGPVDLAALGGSVRLKHLEFRPGAAAQQLRLALEARDLRLEDLTRAAGLREIPGRVDFLIDSLRADPGRIAFDGRLAFRIFGGVLELEGITVDHPFWPYRSVALASGRVTGFDLGAIGRQFGAGVASGILDGRVSGLRILGREVLAFDAELATVPRSGVPQFLDKTAIESIQQIFTGPMGQIERAFFNRFRYEGFGFTASLRDGGFRFRGLYPIEGTEYVMFSRWYQFPRVEIINSLPDIVYDWKQIVDNLRAVGNPSAEDTEKEGGR